MPGLSLWLIPDDNNPFTKTAQELISDTVPRQFTLSKQHDFQPHVTVTPDIDSETLNNKTPQEWLNDLPLPEFKKEHNEVKLELDHLEAEDPFFRKLNIAVEQNSNLTLLVTACRKAAGLEEFKEGEYRPHLSLLYADTPTGEVKNKVPLIEMKIGFAFGKHASVQSDALLIRQHANAEIVQVIYSHAVAAHYAWEEAWYSLILANQLMNGNIPSLRRERLLG